MVKHRRFLLIGLGFMGCWQLVVSMGQYPLALLPSPLSVLETFGTEIFNGQLLRAVGYSLYTIGKGFIIALILAILLLSLSRLKPWGEEVVRFLATVAHPLPGIAILPLVILWAGIGERAILFVIVHSMLWPLLITLKEKIENLIHQYDRIGKAFHLNIVTKVLHIYGMGAVPSVLTGAKIAWSRGWRAFISSEMIFGIVGSKSGLGWYLFEQRVYMNSQKLFAGLLAVLLCGVLLEQLFFQPLERMIEERWRA